MPENAPASVAVNIVLADGCQNFHSEEAYFGWIATRVCKSDKQKVDGGRIVIDLQPLGVTVVSFNLLVQLLISFRCDNPQEKKRRWVLCRHVADCCSTVSAFGIVFGEDDYIYAHLAACAPRVCWSCPVFASGKSTPGEAINVRGGGTFSPDGGWGSYATFDVMTNSCVRMSESQKRDFSDKAEVLKEQMMERLASVDVEGDGIKNGRVKQMLFARLIETGELLEPFTYKEEEIGWTSFRNSDDSLQLKVKTHSTSSLMETSEWYLRGF